MELEFDKEMDSLLRKTGEAGRRALVGDKPDEKPKAHLDADQLSAFAENAMPEKSRALYMSHLADCDRCRRVLSGLIMLNAEAEPVEQRVAAPVISPATIEPWYRRLLLPNLAYVMGGLVLLFGGLIAFTVFQSDQNRESLSQVASEAPAARGPMFEDAHAVTDQMANSNAASAVANKPAMVQAANSTANTANTASNSMAVASGADKQLRKEAAPLDQPGYSLDGVSGAKPTAGVPAAAPPPPPAPLTAEPKTETADAAKAAAESKDDDAKGRTLAKKKSTENEVADLTVNSREMQNAPRTQAGGLAKPQPGPSRDLQQNFPNRANNTSELYEEKRISGKGFQRRNNVWYDNSYRGQTTTNVRRGTEEYRKLDSGLRSIAESFSGVVVVMWTGKAYRIQ